MDQPTLPSIPGVPGHAGTSSSIGQQEPSPVLRVESHTDWVVVAIMPLSILAVTFFWEMRQKQRETAREDREQREMNRRDLAYKDWLRAREDRERSLDAIFQISQDSMRLRYAIEFEYATRARRSDISKELSLSVSPDRTQAIITALNDENIELRNRQRELRAEKVNIVIDYNISLMKLTAIVGEESAAKVVCSSKSFLQTAEHLDKESTKTIIDSLALVSDDLRKLARLIATSYRQLPDELK